MTRIRFRLSLAVAAASMLAFAAVASPAGTTTYVVLYKEQAVPAGVKAAIGGAGGKVVASYPQIGVVIAESSSSAFRSKLNADQHVEAAASTAGFGVRLRSQFETNLLPTGGWGPPSAGDPLTGLQWDMRQVHALDAHRITAGSRSVLVGDLDTGVDPTHPDLAANIDYANSASCMTGAPDTDPEAWFDRFGHGTHTAGTIAAAANGIGIVGMAPRVRIAAVKLAENFIYPEAIICAFMWAGDHRFDVTNNSWWADPWYFNCRNDPVQGAIVKAEQRAIRYAMHRGVVVVASTGNFSDDLAHPTMDIISPDDQPDPQPREVDNSCIVIPAEIPGVIAVSATGVELRKSYYSSYGIGVVDVAAPGGDDLQVNAEAPNGGVLSSVPQWFGDELEPEVPEFFQKECSGGSCVYWAYFEGTSMAAPHVTGAAALVRSRNRTLSPWGVAAKLKRTADPLACPPNPYLWPDFPQFSNGEPQVCEGGPRYNGFYGPGVLNAFRAVKH